MECVYIDDVPVLFDPLPGHDLGPVHPRVAAALTEAVGPRWRDGEWDGEYPLTGHMLIVSLALAEDLAPVFAAHGLRP